jgi:L-ascorbate metabolism protein UlaG (beta-lactamase superfamily)
MDGPWGLMTLNSEEAIKLADLMEPQAIIPIHHHTFSHYVESVNLFQERLQDSKYGKRLFILREGETINRNKQIFPA